MLRPIQTGWRERVQLGLLKITPFRTYSRLIRAVSGIPVPRGLRTPVYGRIVRHLGIDMGDSAQPMEAFASFGELFVRPLQLDARPVDPAEAAVVSPVDGEITATGQTHQGGLLQAKGIDYSLADLVCSRPLADKLEGGPYVTVYLRPSDYHRIHAPLAGQVVKVRHAPGTLLPVQPHVVRGVDGLYVRNERLVLELETVIGPVALVCVAAAGVGNISLSLDAHSGAARWDELRLPVAVEKGQEVARFNLGSTVVVVFPQRGVELIGLEPATTVRVGQRVASLTAGT